MLYRYRRKDGKLEKTPVTKDTLTTPTLGEMIPLAGKKPRTYKAPVTLDVDNKPIRPPLFKIRGKKGA